VLNRFQIYTFTCDKTRFGLKLLIKYFNFIWLRTSYLYCFVFLSFLLFIFIFLLGIIEKPR
jgi:hypothetical protein